MKIINTYTLVDSGNFSKSTEFATLYNEVCNAIISIVNPPTSNIFTINNTLKGNGVVPIKSNFINYLDQHDWKNEKIADPQIRTFRVDTTKKLNNQTYFGVEWETGNISSSHRALNRLLLGMYSNILTGGFLVLPSRNLYKYLTDRVGNLDELSPYFPIWEIHQYHLSNNFLGIIEIEHDAISATAPKIAKGTDGRALR